MVTIVPLTRGAMESEPEDIPKDTSEGTLETKNNLSPELDANLAQLPTVAVRFLIARRETATVREAAAIGISPATVKNWPRK